MKVVIHYHFITGHLIILGVAFAQSLGPGFCHAGPMLVTRGSPPSFAASHIIDVPRSSGGTWPTVSHAETALVPLGFSMKLPKGAIRRRRTLTRLSLATVMDRPCDSTARLERPLV